ncbi:hypothetical protein [Micromonospora sp. NPDC049645]|uniref:hypothetical protein n=1 Tax=Micromonospora sp. NPDC049645 TaxID=3155508 RepID=UPI00341E5C40
MGPDERARLFEQAREWSRRRDDWPEADRLWLRVIDAYREAAQGPGRPGRHDRQQLARALRRRGMLLAAHGRAAEAMAPGGEAVAIFERVHDAVAAEVGEVTAAPRDEALAELVTALVDLAEVAFTAGQPATRRELLGRAVAVGLAAVGAPPSAGPRTRRALGAAYHHQATALLHRHLTRPASADGLRDAALAAARACELRQALLDPARPLSLREMADTYGVYARCLAMTGDVERAGVMLALGNRLVKLLGSAAEQPAQNLRVAAELLGRDGVPTGSAAGARLFRWRRR